MKQNDAPTLVWTTAETAKAIKLRDQTLRTMRSRGDGPPFIKISGNRVGYSPDDVAAWLAERRRRSTVDPGPGRAA